MAGLLCCCLIVKLCRRRQMRAAFDQSFILELEDGNPEVIYSSQFGIIT
jgi:hypothetical protein